MKAALPLILTVATLLLAAVGAAVIDRWSHRRRPFAMRDDGVSSLDDERPAQMLKLPPHIADHIQ